MKTIKPTNCVFHANLGIFYAELGENLKPPRGIDYAIQSFEWAIKFAPEHRRVELRKQRDAFARLQQELRPSAPQTSDAFARLERDSLQEPCGPFARLEREALRGFKRGGR